MESVGIIEGRTQERVTLRLKSVAPYSAELTAGQIGIIADIAEAYGSGTVHITPRQTVEIADIPRGHLPEITAMLEKHGLVPGSSGRALRNVIACSRWCLFNVVPVSDLALKLNRLHGEQTLPGKTTLSLSGCDFSCVRSRTSDIGIIARSDIAVTDKKCKKCSLCIKEPLGCQVDAIEVNDDGVVIHTDKCIRCGFCTNVCKPGSIALKGTGFDLFLGGNGGVKPRAGEFFRHARTEDEVLRMLDHILARYAAVARPAERIGDVIESRGMEVFEV